jgi:predicted HTH transcriptional regulator
VTLENELHDLNDENEKLEYKSFFKYDFKTKMANTDLKKEIVQSIVSFMTHRGGILIIGINDEKKVLGIDKDLKLFRNWDSYQLAIQNTIRDYTKSALSDFFIIKKMENNYVQSM